MDRKIVMSWGDRELTIVPTMELAHDIEQIISVPSYIMSLETNFKMVDTVKIIHAVLTFGGVKVTQEQVYEELAEAPFAEIVPLMVEILQKVFPMFFATSKKTVKKVRAKK